MCFTFSQLVNFSNKDPTFGSNPLKERGRFVSIAEHLGHAMNFKTIKDDTQNIFCRFNICPCNDPFNSNLWIDHTTIPAIIKNRWETFADDVQILLDSLIVMI